MIPSIVKYTSTNLRNKKQYFSEHDMEGTSLNDSSFLLFVTCTSDERSEKRIDVSVGDICLRKLYCKIQIGYKKLALGHLTALLCTRTCPKFLVLLKHMSNRFEIIDL